MAGAIRNQFNLVGNTVNSGTTGGTSGVGSTGTASAAVQAAVAKDAKDWTLDEQKAVAEDIAAKGEASPAYAKAKAAMDAVTKFSVKLTSGKTLEYRIIGINHDDLADGSGKAGLTFEVTNTAMDEQRMNATYTNDGGWEKSEICGRLNSGDLWSLLPTELQTKAKAVTKMTDNKGGGSAGAPSATNDKVFLLSLTEIYGDRQTDGTQYEYYKSKGVRTRTIQGCRRAFITGRAPWIRAAPRTSAVSLVTVTITTTARRTRIASAPPGASSSVYTYRKPAQSCAGFSFSDYSNNLRFVAQVIGLRRNEVIRRLSERLPHFPAITSAAPSYRVHLACRFVATAHLSTDQVNYWNKYSDSLVRYSRFIGVNRRDKYSLYSAVYQLRVCRFISR